MKSKCFGDNFRWRFWPFTLFTLASVTNIAMPSTSLSPDGSELRLIMNFSLENGITEQYDSDFNLINSLNDVDHIDWFPQELCSKYKPFTDRIQDWLALVKYHPYIQGRDPRSNPILFFAGDPV